MKLEVALPASLARKVDDELALVVAEQGVYAAPSVVKVTVNSARNALSVEYSDGDPEAIRAAVGEYVVDLAKRFRRVDKGVLRTVGSFESATLEVGIFEELVERGWALQLGAGQVGLAGRALDVFLEFDRRFLELAVDVFGAERQRYPMLLPTDVLRRCNYFSSFPHLLSMVSHFSEDYERLKEVRDANDGAEAATIVSPDHVEIAAAGLTPAVCYHCYQALENRTLKTSTAFTSLGRCARYESTNMIGLDRLWEFTMREIIFVGEAEWVVSSRERAIEAFCKLMSDLDLSCELRGATDPFFAPIYASKSYWQSNEGLKYEGRFPLPPKDDGKARTLSCSSFNLHQEFFGETFNISLENGAPVHTGCVGFGLDRLVLAYFAQHGLGDKTPLLLGER